MNLLDLAEELTLQPRKTSASRGGEYHCPCPRCGGDDRFMFWPEEDHYWCRQCNANGDSIQFCRDFQNLSFRDACIKTKKGSSPLTNHKTCSINLHPRIPPKLWEDQAKIFTENASQRLLIDQAAIQLTQARGLSFYTIEQYSLGWHPVNAFRRCPEWGLEETEKRKWIHLPAGLVIPLFENNALRKLKIRRSEWETGDPYGKYYEVPSNSNMLPIFGGLSSPVVVIVEAELDAMLVVQETKGLCSCVALGGAQKRPNSDLDHWLQNRQLLLLALDFDDAGKKAYPYWKKTYQNLEPWPVSEEKSPGDYFAKGGCLMAWVANGIENFTITL